MFGSGVLTSGSTRSLVVEDGCLKSRQCAICPEDTQARKEYCEKHVLRHPYAAEVEAEWGRRLKEVSRLEAGGKVYFSCHLFEEVRIFLVGFGMSSVGRLSKNLGLEIEAMRRVVTYMHQSKMVLLLEGKRTLVRLNETTR